MAEMVCRRLMIAAAGSAHCRYLPQYVLQLRSAYAHEVRVLMSASAAYTCPPAAVDRVADAPTLADTGNPPRTMADHRAITRWADVLVVLPATANCLSAVAAGVVDDLVSGAVLAVQKPVLFLPAMRWSVWHSPAIERDVQTLRAGGHYVATPQRDRSVTHGHAFDELGPDPETLMTHLWHFAGTVNERREGRVTLTIA